MREFLIRRPEPRDAAALGMAHVAIWQATYGGMMNPAKLAAMDSQRAQDQWRTLIARLDVLEAQGTTIRCAIDPHLGQVAGFATAEPDHAPDAPAKAHLRALNVLPTYHGTGAAAKLLSAVLEPHTADAYLWVATDNHRAIAFYRKHGFELDGATDFDPDWECHKSRMSTHASGGSG